MGTIIKQRRWRWIGHVIQKENASITKTALYWAPKGRCKLGRPKNTWRRTVETELRGLNQSWNTFQQLAKTDSSGGTLLLPYVPVGTMGSE